MTDKRRGIVDPWRKVEPLHRGPAPAPHEGKKDLQDIDLDADLAVPGKYVIRSANACFDVTSVRVVVPRDALDVLTDCIVALWQVKTLAAMFAKANIGVRTRRVMYNVPDAETLASKLESKNSMIWFIGIPFDMGMARLARIMRSQEARAVVKTYGVTPMLTA